MEGTLRAKLVHEGTRRDVWIGSLLPSDWPEPRRPAHAGTCPSRTRRRIWPYPG